MEASLSGISNWSFLMWSAAAAEKKPIFGSFSAASCALENQQWPVLFISQSEADA